MNFLYKVNRKKIQRMFLKLLLIFKNTLRNYYKVFKVGFFEIRFILNFILVIHLIRYK